MFFSPFSVVNALTLVAEGAREYTADEMRKVFHLPGELDAMHKGLATLAIRYNPQADTPIFGDEETSPPPPASQPM